MAVNRLGRLGRLSGIWLDMATRPQNQGMLGHPGAIRMILLHGESCNFRACYIGCNGWPVTTLSSFSHHCKWGCRDLGIGITFFSDSGTFQ